VKVENKEVSCIIDGENIHRLFKMSCNRMLKYRNAYKWQRRVKKNDLEVEINLDD
jgi:hypothetical protein